MLDFRRSAAPARMQGVSYPDGAFSSCWAGRVASRSAGTVVHGRSNSSRDFECFNRTRPQEGLTAAQPKQMAVSGICLHRIFSRSWFADLSAVESGAGRVQHVARKPYLDIRR
jgi:hypothetical protein